MRREAEDCTGCRACEKSCPVGAIAMREDEEGFLYPETDRERCTDCGLCRKVCPLTGDIRLYRPLRTMAAQYAGDEEGLRRSASGGAFLGLARQVLSGGGVVVGAAYTPDWRVVQTAAESEEGLAALQGSKYVQSDTGDSFEQTRKYLREGRQVLYSGTPCQIGGLNGYLGRDCGALVTVDLICHGVPAPPLFRRYVARLEGRLGGKLTEFVFRDKEKGWGSLTYKYGTEERARKGSGKLDPFYRAYLEGKTYRESCYRCRYAGEKRCGDITIGDCWGVERMLPDFPSRKGVSLVAVNTRKGAALWEEAKAGFVWQEIEPDTAARYNRNLRQPAERPPVRDGIYLVPEGEDIFDGRGFRAGLQVKARAAALVPWGIKREIKKRMCVRGGGGKTKMMRILHVVPNMNAGGIETFIMNIYRCVNREEVQFDFLVHYRKRCFYDDEIERLGGRIYRLSVREDGSLVKYARDLDAFFAGHREYEIVHGHMSSLSFLYMGAAKRHGVKCRIVHSHGDSHEYNLKGWMKYVLFKGARRYATDRFACSVSSGKYLFGDRDFQVIRNPIDCGRFAFDEKTRADIRRELGAEKAAVCGCVARFDQQKNHEFLLEIFAAYAEMDDSAQLWLIGEGPLEGKLREKAGRLGIEDKVRFLGVHRDVERYYQGMDVFLFPSFFEGLGIAAVEAQAAGLPTLISENVPREARITGLARPLSLDAGSGRWAEEIAAVLPIPRRRDAHLEVAEKGFDAHAGAERLTGLYREMREGR